MKHPERKRAIDRSFDPVAAFHQCLSRLPSIPEDERTDEQRRRGVMKKTAVVVTTESRVADILSDEVIAPEYHIFLAKNPQPIINQGDHSKVLDNWKPDIIQFRHFADFLTGYLWIDESGRRHLELCELNMGLVLAGNKAAFNSMFTRYGLTDVDGEWTIADTQSADAPRLTTDFHRQADTEEAQRQAAIDAIIMNYNLENDPVAQAQVRQFGALPPGHYLPPKHDGD
jgi:hypothetical protein